MSRSVGVSWILVLACSCTTFAIDLPYYLAPWRYGAIAWIEENPSDPAFFVARLDRALDQAFSSWELDPIEPHPRWAEAPTWKEWMGSEQLYLTEVRDYASQSTWKLPRHPGRK